MRTCIDCGIDYKYHSSKPLGASADRCCSCRKKDSVKNKKIILLNIAGGGEIGCRMCGYHNTILSLNLVDGVSILGKKDVTEEGKKKQAEKQFILCSNCLGEVEDNKVKYRVTNAKVIPIEVEFYTTKVEVVKTILKPKKQYSSDAIEAEITTDGPKDVRDCGEKKDIERATPFLSAMQDLRESRVD